MDAKTRLNRGLTLTRSSDGGSNNVTSLLTITALAGMQRRATFADLPVELCERIVLLVAYQWAVEDKRSLARLARASRAIHALVRPILFDSVVATARNVSKIRAVLHMFRSTRVLEVEPGLDRAGWDHLHACSSSFPNIDIVTGPLDALFILLPKINTARIITRGQVHLDHLFTPEHLDRGIFSRLTHLRFSGKRGIQFFQSLPETWSSLRITHIMVDQESDDELFIGSDLHTLAMLLRPARLPKLQRLCVLVGDTVGYRSLRNMFEFYPELQGEKRLWLAMRREPRQGDCLNPADNDYWLVGDQVRCGT